VAAKNSPTNGFLLGKKGGISTMSWRSSASPTIVARHKLESRFFHTPCTIVKITGANKYELAFVDGTEIPHKRKTFDSTHFVLCG